MMCSACSRCLCLAESVVFFFFKQKTAYEMRISDWSSDVCSSDLPPATDRGWKDPKIRDNQIHRENVDQRQSERRIALASDNLTRHHEPAATICSHPDSR